MGWALSIRAATARWAGPTRAKNRAATVGRRHAGPVSPPKGNGNMTNNLSRGAAVGTAARRRDRATAPRRPRPGRLQLERLEDRLVPAGDVILHWNAVALDALKNDSLLAHPRQNNP